MNVMIRNGLTQQQIGWTLTGLQPSPEEEWDRLRDFLNLNQDDLAAMRVTMEPLFRRGHELVTGNYDYLLGHHETAVILGWESGADEAHLAERRRFFTIWLARTLGMDFSHDFAQYLFRAGQIHAAHGPREVHVPERYVTGAVSLVQATFARFLSEEMPAHPQIPAALAGWNKVLTLHLHLMLRGYQSARRWDSGELPLSVAFFGKLRALTGRETQPLRIARDSRMEQVLIDIFDYYPQLRPVLFYQEWRQGERIDEKGKPWLLPLPVYRVKGGWRVLRNGRDINYLEKLDTPVVAGDTISLFPPGR